MWCLCNFKTLVSPFTHFLVLLTQGLWDERGESWDIADEADAAL